MSVRGTVLETVARARRGAKFVKHAHSSSFIDPSAQLADGFHYINLYHEQIDANLIESKTHGLILIHNTYLSSFAYNLVLCWLYCQHQDRQQLLDALLAHNFKKFFAEQFYHAHNSIGSRALLLETLLFEQVCMVPVFALKAENQVLSDQADTAAEIMSSVVSFHELGHFFLRTKPGAWQSVIAAEPQVLADLSSQVSESYPAAFVEEFQCDAIAVIFTVQQYENRCSHQFILRVLVFAFAAFAVLFSLARSARATGEAHEADPVETIDFRGLEKIHREHEIQVGLDHDFRVRADLVARLCQGMASGRGIVLYGRDAGFPLENTILEELLQFVDRILDCGDDNARAMSNLVAEALCGHDEGMEYLYLRSKTFKGAGLAPEEGKAAVGTPVSSDARSTASA